MQSILWFLEKLGYGRLWLGLIIALALLGFVAFVTYYIYVSEKARGGGA